MTVDAIERRLAVLERRTFLIAVLVAAIAGERGLALLAGVL